MHQHLSVLHICVQGNHFEQPSARAFDALLDGRFKYFNLETDFKTYVVDGEVHIAQV
jgi:hypothetical protein